MLREIYNINIGDRTPTQFLMHMKSHVRGNNMSDSIERRLSLDQLATTMVRILTPPTDYSPLDKLAVTTDKIFPSFDQRQGSNSSAKHTHR